MVVKDTGYWENADGVHYESHIPEHMLCGDVFEGDCLKHGSDFGQMKSTTKRTVTCARCIEAIEYARNHVVHLRTRK
jgi:hypothetical protein